MTHHTSTESAGTSDTPAHSEAGRLEEQIRAILADPRLEKLSVLAPHPLVVGLTDGDLILLLAPASVWERGRDLLRPFLSRFVEGTATLLLLGKPANGDVNDAIDRGLFSVLPHAASHFELTLAVVRALEHLQSKSHAATQERSLRRYRYEVGELVNIARAMTTERDVNNLLGLILEKCRFVTGADAGSIYVVEAEKKKAQGEPLSVLGPMLRFKLSQNDSVTFDSREFVMPISTRSIAGAVAIGKKSINLPDVYELPAGSPFEFDRRFDQRIGYRTKSMLTVPLISQRDEVIGIIQLINKKRDPRLKLKTADHVHEEVIPFDDRSEELLSMVAAQAGISLENAMLYDEIRQLFDGFVRASVEAIESRDPTTSGHSRRVADLTVSLAKMVTKESSGAYKEASFSLDSLRELEYASLLHDFGKIGVREKVLVKAKKLYDEKLDLVRARFAFVSRSIEVDVLKRKLALIDAGASRGELEELDLELAKRRADLDRAMEAILTANEPTVLAAGDFERIEAIAKETYFDISGQLKLLLEEDEVAALSVKRGSLTTTEYEEISSHVSHTFKFLSRIPWGKTFCHVAEIAGSHHERLNGTGYPNRLHADEIPVQSKMMSIADIFDALTAADRPYKKAVPLERAIDILDYGVKDQHLDGELVRIFKEAKVWELPKGE